MQKFLKSSYLAIILLCLYVPLFAMMIFSFNSGDTITLFKGWSFKWYGELWAYSDFTHSIVVSLFVGALSTLVSIVIAVPACMGILKMNRYKKNKWLGIINIPLINADIVTAVSLLICFSLIGLKLGILSLIASHISFDVPYAMIIILPFMKKIDKDYISSSYDLGANQFQTFMKITIPSLLPSIATAAVVCFSMSFDDFIISYFAGGAVTNVSSFIYSAQRLKPYFNAFGTLLICLILFCVIVYNVLFFVKSKRIQDKNNIISGTYKSKLQNKLYKKLVNYYSELNNQVISKKTLNLNKYILYVYYNFLYKYYSKKNIDVKIYKIAAKKEKILEEIKWVKKITSQYEKTKIALEKSNLKFLNDKNNQKKISASIIRKETRLKKLQRDIDWIEEKNLDSAEMINDLKEEILLTEKQILDNPKNKNSLVKELKQLRKEVAYLMEGPLTYKLKMIIDKQNEIKKKNNNQIEELYVKRKNARQNLYEIKSVTFKFDLKIDKLSDSNELNSLKEERRLFLEDYKVKLRNKIELVEEKLNNLTKSTIDKKNKLINNDSENKTNIIKKHSFGYGRFKRIFKGVFLSFVLIGATAGFAIVYYMQSNFDLIIANWGSYIDRTVIKDFEKRYGVKINYQEYDSNETLYNKQQYFNYDLMVPSDYMVQKLAEEDKIQKIDWTKINTKYSNELNKNNDNKNKFSDNKNDNYFEDKIYQLQNQNGLNMTNNLTNYCLPYWWGDVVIAFNINNPKVLSFLSDKKIDYKGSEISSHFSWNNLWEAADYGLNIDLNSDPKNLFMYGYQKNYGISQPADFDPSKFKGTTLNDSLNVVQKSLENLLINKKNVQLADDQLIDNIASGKSDVAVLYNGDLNYGIMQGNQKYIFGVPDSGTNIWTDNIVISKENRNLDLSYKFINFIYTNDIQLKNVNETGITSTIKNFNNNKDNYNKMNVNKDIYNFSDYIDKKKKESPEGFKISSYKYNKDLDNDVVERYTKIISKLI